MRDFHVNWNVVNSTPTGAYAQVNDIGDVLRRAKIATVPADRLDLVRQYLTLAKEQPTSSRLTQSQEVVRTTPGYNLDKDMTSKIVMTNVLMPYCSAFGTSYDFAFTNYHSLNFMSASTMPTGSALLYPMSCSATNGVGSIISGSYVPSGGFAFDFWVNPHYTEDAIGAEFKAGTLLHVSGCFALSMMSGSAKAPNGLSSGFRLALQVSAAANTPPAQINPLGAVAGVFISDDNALVANRWQHVTVQWGGSSYNFGSGSFIVDGVTAGNFYYPSSSIAATYEPGGLTPSMIVVGNYCELAPGDSSYFFSEAAQTRFGIPVTGSALNASTTQDQPSAFLLSHPFKGEVHELKLFSRPLQTNEIAALRTTGADTSDPALLFYLPPMFTRESPSRSVDINNSAAGGVLVHPFNSIDGTTKHPFNVDLSFDTGAHYINLENYTRDFVTGNYPRLIMLTGSVIRGNTAALTANQFLYATSSVVKASLMVLPCDNGAFTPNYFQLLSSLDSGSFHNDNGDLAYNLVSLRDMYPLESIYDMVDPVSGSGTLNTDTNTQSIIAALAGFTATSSFGTLAQQRTPAILQRVQENGSLQVCMFNISNLFYGNRISPGTFSITDGNISGSGGKLSMTLKDDGYGSLYRADATGSWAVGNSVGNIFYDNGLVLIKSPHLYFFGKDGFTCTFKGDRNVHTMKAELYANPLELVSSSNPGWSPGLEASDDPLVNLDNRYVYITDIYVHDENLNVIMKTKIRQPILKRASDKLKFNLAMDW